MSKNNPILQVLDAGHLNWVQGGVFADLRKAGGKVFNDEPEYMVPPNSFINFLRWLRCCARIATQRRILFSSITPLENYARFPKLLPWQIIGLWFTHKDGEFNESEIRALRRSQIIFLHSAREAKKIEKVCSSKRIVMLAAIDPSRFSRSVKKGKRIVWVGTATGRKNPELLLEIVKALKGEEFLVLGKNWLRSGYGKNLFELGNVEYREIERPLVVDDLDGCDIFIMTSRVEGGPMPLMETLAAGLVPVSTDTGFVREIYSEAQIPENLIVPAERDHFVSGILTARKLVETGLEPNRAAVLALDFSRLATLLDDNLK